MIESIKILTDNIEKVIVGKKDAVIKVICTMIAEGHVLIEDVPGVGKTRLVSVLSDSVEGKFNRIQLTPDIMPSDILGFSMIDPTSRQMEYKTGAAVCNFLLADEINRASPKTQSALLEVMEEHQISIDGKTIPLPKPFMVLATQNPVETYGTYHLPEAQMDRFMMKISMGYPDPSEEMEIISRSENTSSNDKLSSVMNTDDIKVHIENAKKVYCGSSVKSYMVNILNATRNSPYIKLGASPRAGIALMRSAKAFAYINGKDHVSPSDVKKIMTAVIAHRLILSPKGKSTFQGPEALTEDIAERVPVPVK